jgi:hypothetical protein
MDADAERQSNDPEARLERALIEEFLAKYGHNLCSVSALPRNDRESLLRSATSFAALTLAEIDARAHFVPEIG